eukprot:gene5741-6034_t
MARRAEACSPGVLRRAYQECSPGVLTRRAHLGVLTERAEVVRGGPRGWSGVVTAGAGWWPPWWPGGGLMADLS